MPVYTTNVETFRTSRMHSVVINAEGGWENKLENNVSFLQKVVVRTRVTRQAQIATSETRAVSVGLLNSTSCGCKDRYWRCPRNALV